MTTEPEGMKVLVVGPESSGTRMMTALLARCEGVETIHSSPAFKYYEPTGLKYNPTKYDAAVLIVRNGSWNAQSMVEREHFRADVYRSPYEQIFYDLADVTEAFTMGTTSLYVVTYESMVYETEHCISALCKDLGVQPPVGYDTVKNGNEKFWSDEGWEGDNRTTVERL